MKKCFKRAVAVFLALLFCVTALSETAPFEVSAKTSNVPNITYLAQKETDRVVIKWKKLDKAKWYIIQRKTGSGNFKTISKAQVTKSNVISYTDKTVSPGNKYTYRIRTCTNKGVGYGGFSPERKITTTNLLVKLITPYWSKNFTKYETGRYITMGGLKYTNGYLMNGKKDGTSTAFFNLQNKYKRIVFYVGGVPYSENAGDLVIYGDNKEIWKNSEPIQSTDVPRKKTVSVSGVHKLQLEFKGDFHIGLVNVKIYK